MVPRGGLPYNPGPVVSPKVTKSAVRPAAPRHRGHSLAPEHLGELGAAAALVTAIGGMAIFITALGMVVTGLTLPGRFAGSTPPPNVGQLGLPQVLGGIGLLILGTLMVGSSLALLGGLARSRLFAVAISAISAALAVAGFVILLAPTRRDVVLLAALAVAALAFGAAAVILARLRR